MTSAQMLPVSPAATRRLIVLDQNISGIGGHFAELASVILEGGNRLGFEPWLISHENLELAQVKGSKSSESTASIWDSMSDHGRILPGFTVAKMHRWSLGSNGHSQLCRNSLGAPRSAGLRSLWQNVVDRLHKESPQSMLKQYSKTITGLFRQLSLTPNDMILFATCDDFSVLAAASAIRQLNSSATFDLHFLFHTQLLDQRSARWRQRGYCNREYILQMEEAKRLLNGHKSYFWATTSELADQLNYMTDQFCVERGCAPTTHWYSIDYPVRREFSPISRPPHSPKRLIMGGKVRSEKGAKEIRRLVAAIWDSQLANGRWQLLLQGSPRDARRLLPTQIYKNICLPDDQSAQARPIRFLDSKLSATDYASLIHSADAGLFLYDAKRYYARCSGVLVEMLSAGIPVIVPSACWLSRQLAEPVSTWMAQREMADLLFESLDLQNLHWRSRWKEFSFDPADARVVSVELYLASPQADDYVGLQLEQANSAGLTETNYCEVFEHLPVRSCFRIIQSAGICKLRVGLPYRQRNLQLQRVIIRKVSDSSKAAHASSAIGLMAANSQEIPRLLQELGDSYEHYRSTAIEHSRTYHERHSGEAFVKRMITASSNS